MISRLAARRRRRERGVSSIAIGIMMPMIVASAGLGIDVGNLALEANKIEKAADAAALAVGQDCALASRPDSTLAQKNKCTPAGAQATAQLMANANSGGTTQLVANVSPTSTGLSVTVTKDVKMPLGSAVGVDERQVEASAKVRWNEVPVAASTFPLAMSICDYYEWKASSDKDANKLYRYDMYQGSWGLPQLYADTCSTPLGNITTNGGSMWLPSLGALVGGDCNIDTRLGNIITGTIISTGLTLPYACMQKARQLEVGSVYLFPIYRTTSLLGLNINVSAKIEGYAPFKVTGWRIGSLLSGNTSYNDTSAPTCRSGLIINNCYGIQGHFTGAIGSLDGVTEWGTPLNGLDLGIVLPKLVG